MSSDWNKQEERGTPFMLYLIRWIALHLGRRTARLILYPITLYFLLFAASARRASRNYLQRIQKNPVRWWYVAKHIHHFSATILDRVFFLTGQFSRLDINAHNLDLVEKYLTAGKGCILLGSHIGSFEALRALAISRHQFPAKVLMQEAHNEMITRILNTLNPDIAESVIQPGRPDSLLMAHEYLQQGYLVGMLGDRVIDEHKTTTCSVLGAKARLPTGPLLAASVLAAPVILFFGIYAGGNRYDIYFEEFDDRIMIDRKQRDQELHDQVQKYADRLTYHARQSPYNWFNFYDFWEDDI